MSCAGRVTAETRHVVSAAVLSEESRELRGRRYVPRSIEVVWRRTGGTPWRSGWVVLYGVQLKQDGSEGTRGVKEVFWTDGDERFRDDCPEWAVGFYLATRPEIGACAIISPGVAAS